MIINNLKLITILLINYRTYDLTFQCVESLQKYYPNVTLLLIDNGSHDLSTEYVIRCEKQKDNVSAIRNDSNLNHGPAIDQGIRNAKHAYILTLDSDCIIKKPGFIEKMLLKFGHPDMYAVGNLEYLDHFGYTVTNTRAFYTKYIQPHCMLIDRQKYLKLKPFIHHGSPGIKNMRHATQKGYLLSDFPIEEYVHHIGGGTVDKYGYNLGLRHKLENILHIFLSKLQQK
jgi:glycosyltransferase involved in cell wall biosynthesis